MMGLVMSPGLFAARECDMDKEKIKVIRRRIEDRLRKSSDDTILKIARFLGVKLE